MMKTSRWRSRNRFLFAGATVAAALAVAVAGLAAPALARPSAPASSASTNVRGPGYPPPKGIYKPFTNCPIAVDNALMNESVGGDAVACVAGQAANGTLTLGNITTPVVQPVNVQFGAWDPQNATFGGDNPGGIEQFAGGILPPPSGLSSMLVTKRDLIPESLTTALGCPSSVATVENICQQAAAKPADNQVFALAQQVGPIRDFDLFTWTQAVKFQLINPLLGSSCSIGTDAFPVVLHPQLMGTPGTTITVANDPVPTVHPDDIVLTLNDVNAVDTTFSAPGVTGCGPGGAKNIFVDEALDTSSGLPAASGVNSLTLNGSFALAVNFTSEDSSFTQPQDDASNLLAAFKASTNGEHSVKHFISMSQAQNLLGPHGFSPQG